WLTVIVIPDDIGIGLNRCGDARAACGAGGTRRETDMSGCRAVDAFRCSCDRASYPDDGTVGGADLAGAIEIQPPNNNTVATTRTVRHRLMAVLAAGSGPASTG